MPGHPIAPVIMWLALIRVLLDTLRALTVERDALREDTMDARNRAVSRGDITLPRNVRRIIECYIPFLINIKTYIGIIIPFFEKLFYIFKKYFVIHY